MLTRCFTITKAERSVSAKQGRSPSSSLPFKGLVTEETTEIVTFFGKLSKDVNIYQQARREGGCDECARTPPPQTAEVHFFVKKINSKKKIIVLFCLFCSNSLIA